MQLPLEFRVLHLLRRRAPSIEWSARRVLWCVHDYRHVIDVESQAARLADLIASGELTRIKDGPATLRAFCEKEKARSAPNVIPIQPSPYDRLETSWPPASEGAT